MRTSNFSFDDASLIRGFGNPPEASSTAITLDGRSEEQLVIVFVRKGSRQVLCIDEGPVCNARRREGDDGLSIAT